jgi:cellulose synthase operon protein C
VAGSVLLTTGTCLAHYFQTGRIAQALLWQADHAEQEDRLNDAVKYLGRYLEFVPEDGDVRARLGRLLAGDKLAVNTRARERALFVLEQVLAREPARNDLRPLLVKLAMDLKRWKLAGDHLQVLHKAQPEDGSLEYLFGRWHEAQQQFAEAEPWYAKAIKHAPQQIDSYVRLADLIQRRLGKDRPRARVAQAQKVLDQLVANNPEAFQAYLARSRYRQQHGNPDGAATDAARALALAPDQVEVLLAVAKVAELARDFDQARTHLERGLKLHPGDTRLYEALASVELMAGQRPEALACVRRGIRAASGTARTDLLWSLTNLLLDGDDLAEAQATIAELRKLNVSPAALGYLQSRVLMGEGRWAEAARLLERTRPLIEILPELTRRVDLYLGQCYAQLHEPSLQLTAYNRALAYDPESLPARLGLASAQAAVGRTEEAVTQYRRICALPDAPAGARLDLARLLILQNLQRSEHHWKEVDEAIRQAEQGKADPVQLVLLRVEVLAAQDRLDQAVRLLEQARKEQPKEVALWTALAALAERRGQPEQAKHLLDEAEQQGGDGVLLRLARARTWLQRPAAEAGPALRRLADGLDRFGPEDQATLLSGLAGVAFRRGDLPEAERLWDQLAALPHHANDVRLRLLLFDLALHGGNETTVQRRLGDIERVEGNRGTLWRYAEAVRLIWLAKQGKKADLDQARAHLDWVATQRPTWSAALVAKADLEVLKTNPEQAIANYRKAIELGETSPQVIRQLVQLLYDRQRFAEADQEIQRLQKRTVVAADLQRLAADISLRNDAPARAVELAQEAVSADSTDYRDHLWLGQILAASGRMPRDAEKHLRRAVELADQLPVTWVTLVRYLAFTDRNPEAEVVMAQAQRKLPPDKLSLALAECHEVLGHRDQANEQYQAAVKARPDDVLVLRSVAAHAMRAGRFQDAEPYLRAILEGKGKVAEADVDWARHSLAVVLTAQNDYPKLLQALTLVGLKLNAAGAVTDMEQGAEEPTAEEQLARAQVLSLQPLRKLRARALTLLEELHRRQRLSPDDQFLLSQLYQGEGYLPKARATLSDLVALSPKNQTYQITYIQVLIEQQDFTVAERALDQLEQLEKARKVEPNTFRTVQLRALALEARGAGDKALALIRQHATRPGARPEEALVLVEYLARQKRAAEAFALCEEAWKTCPPEVVSAASIVLLRTTGSSDRDCRRVEGRIQEALKQKPDSVALRLHLADLQDMRQRFDDAESLYRQVLERDPGNVVALNNRAWLLALRPHKAGEALPLIAQAVATLGPRPDLLDTRAIAYLSHGMNEQAVADLERVVAEAPTASHYFHLARAYRAADKVDAAVQALRRARELGLQSVRLHPLERAACDRLLAELGHK